jgi:hypothetical protein
MTKAEELSNPGSCFSHSQDDEPLFVLCARDQIASAIVRDWAERAAYRGVNAAKINEALQLAEAMDVWRKAHGGGKLPD